MSKLVGVALTVKTRAGDNPMVHKAMELAQRGDVIVVDAGGETSQAIIGELMQKRYRWNSRNSSQSAHTAHRRFR